MFFKDKIEGLKVMREGIYSEERFWGWGRGKEGREERG